MGVLDVVIVGAGAAGIAAARAASAAGLDAIVLEAGPRIGGRAFTDHTSFGVPFDRGCHWLHSASINPMVAEAANHGCTVVRRRWSPRVHDGDGWLGDDERARLLEYFHEGIAAIEAAGADGRDVAAEQALDREARWYALLSHWIAAISGTDPDACSTRAWAEDDDTEENWPLVEGYGTLVARLGLELPVRLQTPVREIDARRRHVRVSTGHGTLETRTVILTVSTGVLAGEGIHFLPRLPDWKLEAIDAIPMGRADKIALALRRDVFGMGDSGYAILAPPAPDTIGFQIRPGGHALAIGYVAGRHAAALAEAGPEAAVECAVAQLEAMFGSSVREVIGRTAVTSWARDPLFLGAYSSARPGRAHLREQLAAPIDDRIFFAGEATSPRAFSTAHGAFESGRRALSDVATVLGRIHVTP